MKRILLFQILSLLLIIPAFAVCPDEAFLGIESNGLSEEKARLLGFDNPYGSYVSRVIPHTAAEQAGLQPFDYIYQIDDKAVSEDADLVDLLSEYNPGDKVTVHFFRKGHYESVRVALGEYPEDWEDAGSDEDEAFLGISWVDRPEDAPTTGVAVEIVSGSAADAMGLQDGDIINSIDGYPMLDWDDILTFIENAHPDQVIHINFYRNGVVKEAQGPLLSWDDLEEAEEAEAWEDQPDPEAQDEDRAFMGIYAEMISEEKAMKMGLEHNFGTLVTGVIPNTGASKAGLQLFDYLYGIDAYRAGEDQHFGFILMKYKPGDKAKLYFIRKGQPKTADITFGKKPEELMEKKEMNSCEDTFLGIMSVEDVEPGELGDIVIKPVSNSTAMEMGLKEGDIIKTLNGYPMYDWMDIGYVLDNLKVGDQLSVGYERDGVEGKGVGKIKSYAATKNCEDCDCDELEDWKEDFNIVMPDINIDLPGMPKTPRAPEPAQRPDVAGMKVDVQDASDADIRQVNDKSTNKMQAGNSLLVQNLKLSPNPHEGRFSLTFDLPQRGQTTVRIFNNLGRMIYEYDLGEFSGSFSDQVDISQNGPGSYFLEIRQGDKSNVKKVVLSGK